MDNKNTNIKDRILQIAKYHGVSYENFSAEIGMTYASFKGQQKKTPINSNALEILISKYPHVSAEWLLTGEGEMLKSLKEESNTVSTDIVSSEMDTLRLLVKSQQEVISLLKTQIDNNRRERELLERTISNLERMISDKDEQIRFLQGQNGDLQATIHNLTAVAETEVEPNEKRPKRKDVPRADDCKR